jgi:hypothetical protein
MELLNPVTKLFRMRGGKTAGERENNFIREKCIFFARKILCR